MILLALAAMAAAGFRCTAPENPSGPPVVIELRRERGALVDQHRRRYVVLGENQNGLAAGLWLAGRDMVSDTPYVGARTIVINKVTGAFSLTQPSVPVEGAVETVAGICTRF